MEIKQHTFKQLVGQEISKEIRKYFERNENENTKLQGSSESSAQGIFTATNIYSKAEDQINSLIVCLKELGKEEQTKPKAGRRKAIVIA